MTKRVVWAGPQPAVAHDIRVSAHVSSLLSVLGFAFDLVISPCPVGLPDAQFAKDERGANHLHSRKVIYQSSSGLLHIEVFLESLGEESATPEPGHW